MKKTLTTQIVCILILTFLGTGYAGGLKAYYTKVDSGEDFEKYSRTGPHADIIVNINDTGKLVFSRSSSFLPYWETAKGKWFVDEIIERSGDGPDSRPDKVNTYSRVVIIENDAKKATIHWRYQAQFSGTNPHTNVTPTGFVDEYFTIRSNGKVTRTIRQGTEKYDDWNDAANTRTQEIKLTAGGISSKPPTDRKPLSKPKALKGSRLIKKTVVKPKKHWRFDEGAGDTTTESIDKTNCGILGPKSYWKKGVSGTALAFDGYNSLVTLPAENAPEISSALTLEAWVAIGAYPWNLAPIVQRADDNSYILGIGGRGKVAFELRIGDKWEKLKSDKRLERRKWYHIAGVFDKTTGSMRIYIDGEENASKSVAHEDIRPTKDPIKIGKGKDRRPIDPVRRNTFIDSYSFDGLIDEVRIYDVALDAGQVRQTYKSFGLSDSAKQKPDMDKRVLPAGKSTGKFGAYYTHLKFYDTWDGMWRFADHPDVVVQFDEQPTRFVFWRGTCFIAMLVNEKGQWYSNEFNETWNTSGGKGCQEPMSDKEGHTNHARIIENTPARIVIQWRYPLIDVHRVTANYNKETGWGDWSDWYFYIYPDGVAAKTMRLWSHGRINHEWQEGMVITGPDQHPEQVLETTPALILADINGKKSEYSWANGPPKGVNYRDQKIHIVNYKAEYDPFTIGDFNKGNVYGGEVTDYAVFPSWNHWPVAQMSSDGRYAKFPDRTSHSSLTHVYLNVHEKVDGDAPWQERLLLEGMTNKDASELAPLAKSWLQAPKLEAATGCKSRGFDKGQRAYLLTAESKAMSFTINASAESPIVNPCFVIQNWGSDKKAKVKVNAKNVKNGRSFRQGIITDTDGTETMVIWLRLESTESTEFAIGK